LATSALRTRRTLALLTLWALTSASAQQAAKKAPVPGPMLEAGVEDFDTPDFTLSLVKTSQTVAALKPKGGDGFDFTPGDLLVARSQNGYFHLGDLTLRLRSNDSDRWVNYSTAASRTPVRALPAAGETLASADLAPTLPSDIPLEIVRTWAVDQGKLVLRFTLTNTSAKVVEVGALGLPIVFNNVLNDRSL